MKAAPAPAARPHVNGPFQDALVLEYSRRLAAASNAIIEGMCAERGVTHAELATWIAAAASAPISGDKP